VPEELLEHKVFDVNRKRLSNLLEEKNLDLLILASPSNVTYATGIRSPSGILVLSKECPPTLVVPLLDYDRTVSQAPPEADILIAYRGGEESITAEVPKKKVIKGGLSDAAKHIAEKCGAKRVGADLSATSYQMARALIEKLEAVDLASDIFRLRAVKSPDEVALIEKAVRIAEEGFRRLLDYIDSGITEQKAAGKLFYEMLSRGAWYEAFPTIVAFYSNTAYPHHTPTGLSLGAPGPLLVDWGAIHMGYRSDMTRTLWHGGPAPARFKRVLEAVLQAQEEAMDTIAEGVEAWEPDRAARRVLEAEGLGKYFIHGLGHGVGVDIHEEPYLRPGSKTVLEKNMVVTVEPGVYLTGLYGIRIEDMVLVTPSGAKRLTRLPKLL
jgi:Xaa-Pro dipeptidase